MLVNTHKRWRFQRESLEKKRAANRKIWDYTFLKTVNRVVVESEWTSWKFLEVSFAFETLGEF